MTPADLVEGLAAELGAIAALVAGGKRAWDSDELIRLSVERRWITAGNYAELYRRAMNLPTGTNPWSELYDYRCLLAHALPETIDSDRVWADTNSDLVRLRREVNTAVGGQRFSLVAKERDPP